MLRAVILAMVVVFAIGMIIPMATEHTEAGAKEQERQYIKKTRAEKFRYRTRFRIASYSSSTRYKRTTLLLKSEGKNTEPVTSTVKETNTVPEEAPVIPEVAVAGEAKTATRITTSGKSVRSKAKRRSSVRYRKVKRYRSSTARKASTTKRSSTRGRTVRSSSARKYTARWWHNYRARQKQEQALAKRKAVMRAKREALQRQHAAPDTYAFVDQAGSQTDNPNTETQLVVNADGTVSVVVVSLANGETIDTGRRRTLAGISTVLLRRTVIDQMIVENGWVENDYHKEVNGQKVYVVVAKAPDSKHRIRSRTFYFAESEGKIYRVAASAPKDEPEQAARESEKMVLSLQEKKRPQQALKPKTEEEQEIAP